MRPIVIKIEASSDIEHAVITERNRQQITFELKTKRNIVIQNITNCVEVLALDKDDLKNVKAMDLVHEMPNLAKILRESVIGAKNWTDMVEEAVTLHRAAQALLNASKEDEHTESN